MKIKFILLFVLSLLFSGCGHMSSFNSIEGKLLNEEHYATINDIDYQSGESTAFGVGLTNKVKQKSNGGFSFDYSIYPDLSYESSELVTHNSTVSEVNKKLDMNRVSMFYSLRGIMFSPVGTFEIDVGAGLSYFDAYNDQTQTGKVEPTFRYEGTYTLFLLPRLYSAVSFTFQESSKGTYSEYYSMVYKLGFLFGGQ